MSHLSSTSTNVFRKSLREWQSNYKARQSALAILTDGETPASAAPAREKRLVSRKHRARKPSAV